MRKSYLLLIIGSLSFASSLAYGAGAGGVPVGTVISQIANIVLLIALIALSQRKTISKAFADKKQSYLDRLQAASLSKKQAEDQLQEVSERLDQIKATYHQQVAKAKDQAEQSYKEQLKKAAQEAERLEQMALMSLEYEKQKEIERLRLEAYQKSAQLAETQLNENFSLQQQKAWNDHFSMATQGGH